MIAWVCGTFSQVFDGRDALELEGSLGPHEILEYRRLKVPKRRDEWLAARVAIKELIRRCCPEKMDAGIRQIETIKDTSGVPHVEIAGKVLEGRLSLSHSQGRFLCAFDTDGRALGVDLEHIERRLPEFIEDYFTLHEQMKLWIAPEEHAPLIATLIWSAKEAVLKALSLGLNLDTRSIEIHFNEGESLSPREWQKLEFGSAVKESSSLHLFWRREDDFVLTLCTMGELPFSACRVRSIGQEPRRKSSRVGREASGSDSVVNPHV